MIAALALAAAQAAPVTPPAQCSIVLTGAHVWNGTGFDTRDLAFRDGRFVPPAADMRRANGGALWLIPPFADAHTHNIDTPAGAEDQAHKRAITSGVFYALNPNNIRPAGPTPAARPGQVELQAAGGGLTRPGGHPEPLYRFMADQGWLGPVKAADLPGRAFHLATTPAQVRAALAAVKASGAAMVKLYLLNHDGPESGGLSGELFDLAAAEARRAGLRPIVHVENAADFRRAVAAGVHAVVHTPYAVPDEKHPAADQMIAAADAAAAARAGVIVVPTITVALATADGARLAAVQAVQRHNLSVLRDAGVKLAVGADHFALGLHDEITALRATALFEGAAVIAMATTNGAELAFPGRRLGRLADGYEASFIGYWQNPIGNWSLVREPAVGLRAGRVMVDAVGLLSRACGGDAPAQRPVG